MADVNLTSTYTLTTIMNAAALNGHPTNAVSSTVEILEGKVSEYSLVATVSGATPVVVLTVEYANVGGTTWYTNNLITGGTFKLHEASTLGAITNYIINLDVKSSSTIRVRATSGAGNGADTEVTLAIRGNAFDVADTKCVMTTSSSGLPVYLKTIDSTYLDTDRLKVSTGVPPIIQPNQWNPTYFSATYLSATTLTLAGWAWGTLDTTNAYCPYLVYRPTGGVEQVIVNGSVNQATGNTIGIKINAGVLTVTNAGNIFAATDEQYFVGVVTYDKAYDSLHDANKTYELNSSNSWFINETVAEETNVTDGTYRYYITMDYYRRCDFQLILDGGSGTVTVTFQATFQDDGTAPATCHYEDVTLDTFGVVNFTADTLCVDDAEYLGRAKYIRITVVSNTGGANDGDYTIYANRRW